MLANEPKAPVKNKQEKAPSRDIRFFNTAPPCLDFKDGENMDEDNLGKLVRKIPTQEIGIDMRLLGGGVAILGIGIGVLAFATLNVATLGAAGLAVLSIAAFLVIAGMGIAAYGLYENNSDNEDEISASAFCY